MTPSPNNPTTLLIIGCSGYVGRLVVPALAERFTIRLFDRVAPDYLSTLNSQPSILLGDVTDPDAIEKAVQGVDILLYMAMGRVGQWGINDIASCYDVNVKGVHLAVDAAARAGVKRAVYTSSLSVYDGSDLLSGAFDREDAVHPEPRTVYGHTKWLGEEACRFVNRVHNLPITALRLYHPVSRETWLERHDPARVDAYTSGPDLARALIAALQWEHEGFEIFHVTGDTSGRAYRHEKAKRLLNWEPLEGR
jgi:nucleoside-diphosphate-sugar epimerase